MHFVHFSLIAVEVGFEIIFINKLYNKCHVFYTFTYFKVTSEFIID